MAYDDVITALAPTNRWKLDGDYLDSGGGSTRDGSASGAPGFTSGGGIISSEPLWEALDADGVDDVVGIGDSPEINTGTGYTFVRRSWSIWIEHDVNQGTVGDGQVIWEQGGGTNAFSIYTYNDQLYACIAESNVQRGFANVTIATGTVYHIGVSVDLTLASDNIKLYLNGALVATATTSCGTDLSSHSGNVAIAGDDQGNRQHTNGSLTGHFDGRIQDVCHWYEVALSGTDFANIYAAGIGNSGEASDGQASGESWSVQQTTSRAVSEGLSAGEVETGQLATEGGIVEGATAGESSVGQLSVMLAFQSAAAAGGAFGVAATIQSQFNERLSGGDSSEVIAILGEFLQSALGGDGWSVRVDYATEVAEGQRSSAASAATAVYEIQLGEGAAAGDVRGGTQATVSQFVTRLLASGSFPPTATYAVSVSDGGIAGDGHKVNQSLLGQLIEQALAGQSTTGVTVVIDFVRLIQVSGATAKTIAIAGATSRADLVRGARPRIKQLEGTIA
jgi:uncharacterized protein YfiM (DUF2279 family)